MRKNKVATVTGKETGTFFNLGNGPLSLGAIEAELPKIQKAISTLPEGKEKTTIAHGFANFYGYVKSCDWLRGVGANTPVSA